MKIKAGDKVMLTSNAQYYDGGQIPNWVYDDVWIVSSVNGNRVVIDKNISGTRSIFSPVDVKYIKKKEDSIRKTSDKKESSTIKPREKQSNNIKSDKPKQGSMKISQKGVALVAKYEGCQLKAYKCPAGVWTIGYGHTAGVKPGQTITKEKATAMLTEDLKKYGDYVNDCVHRRLIKFTLTQNQFDALTSFTYNCGAGNLQKLVSGNSSQTIAEKLLLYNKGGGKVLPGLVKRREEERKLFLS